MRHKKEKKQEPLLKLNLGLGDKQDFERVTHDLTKFPWPYKNDSVSETWNFFGLSKIPNHLRGKYMDELWRILKPKAQATFVSPYWSAMRAYSDFDYEWPPLCEMSFLYFNREWRKQNNTHPELKCDFDFNYGYTLDPDVQTRTEEVRNDWIKHRTNTALDLQIVLTKRAEFKA